MIDDDFVPRLSNNMDEIIIATGNYNKLSKSVDILFNYSDNPELDKNNFDLVLKNMFITGYMSSLMLLVNNIKTYIKDNHGNDNIEVSEILAYAKIGKMVTEMLNDIDK